MPAAATRTRTTTVRSRARTRELAHRHADGIDVKLLWHTARNALSVAVADSRTGDSFELVLGSRDRALDVFEHPYAYAAHRGLDYLVPSRNAEYAVAA
jgi:hypothetical protein